MMGKKSFKEVVLEVSDGLLGTVTDLLLSFVFYEIVVLERPTMYSVVVRAPQEMERMLTRINYKTIKRALAQLVSRGLIEKNGRELVITQKGSGRLRELLPSIGGKLTRQNGEVYLIAYDIFESTRRGRDQLRRFFKQQKLVSIQESIYLSVRDLHQEIEDFVREREIGGQILVTKLGRDSVIGGKGVAFFLQQAYRLDELATKYLDFIEKFSQTDQKRVSRIAVDFAFNRVYRLDPNLPEEFLPVDWPGKKAYELYLHLININH